MSSCSYTPFLSNHTIDLLSPILAQLMAFVWRSYKPSWYYLSNSNKWLVSHAINITSHGQQHWNICWTYLNFISNKLEAQLIQTHATIHQLPTSASSQRATELVALNDQSRKARETNHQGRRTWEDGVHNHSQVVDQDPTLHHSLLQWRSCLLDLDCSSTQYHTTAYHQCSVSSVSILR